MILISRTLMPMDESLVRISRIPGRAQMIMVANGEAEKYLAIVNLHNHEITASEARDFVGDVEEFWTMLKRRPCRLC